ncbi:MAG TPA: ATP-dependent protease ATPase subunit HslU [Thermomicrobiales bacterium]|jgi:ATP-dependent HslUV protease ATP-binding subunit HslU
MDSLTPAAIVAALDKYIIGQRDAKRAIAVALRSRMRRALLPEDLRDEVSPKNILLIGPTGVGKTEIARRVAKIVDAPFLKVEATRFTEVGFVGRDVESIIRDLLEVSVDQVDARQFEDVRAEAERAADERLATYILQQREGISPARRSAAARRGRRGAAAPVVAEQQGISAEARRQQRQGILTQLRDKQLESEMVEIEVAIAPPDPFDFHDGDGHEAVEPAGRGHRSLPPLGPERRVRRLPVADARRVLTEEEADRLIDWDGVLDEAIRRVEDGGIVFLDEVDKIVGDGGESGPNVSDEGVQRDLLPIVEGATVTTRYGPVKTDHILFIGAGAFNGVKPSDLIPEFQGRFPLRVELDPLDEEALYAILTEPTNSLSRQYTALLATEGVTLVLADDALREVAALAATLNERQEDIGARRLATIMERTLEDLSFDAPTRSGETVTIDATFVRERLGDLVEDEDLSNYIL